MIEKFYQFGGFVYGVTVSGKSPRFKGYEKNDLLQIVLYSKNFHSWEEVKAGLDNLPIRARIN